MQSLSKALLFVIFLALGFSCNKDKSGINYLALLEDTPSNKYYDTDIFKDNYPQIYGTWQVIGTSGGFTGAGYSPDFDYLLIKPNAIFGILRNDSLITTGKIKIIDDPDFDLLIHFISDTNPHEVGVNIIFDYEKFVVFRSDSLSLYSTCCDRFDTHLKRVE